MKTPARGGLPLTALAATLTVGTGAVDVASFTRLGGVFSSVMTGNLVVFGYAVSTVSVLMLLSTVIAVGGYALGVLAGTLVAGRPRSDGPLWPPRVTLTLVLESLVLAVFGVGWVLTGGRPGVTWQAVLLGLSALAMGLQSAAMCGLGGRTSISTTYLTGTLTGVLPALLTRARLRSTDRRSIVILAALFAGAAMGGLLIGTVPAAFPALPLAAVAAVIVRAARHHRH
ncbi:hypothetical protein Misp01_08220 [Microtetraspora sp. NBRC 13810]|uniref:YoaK family protein n=1 Tax=Microtetraspora sp. NBRC 13810 TaxID=3030990 RepID=UPI0024A5E792|nr:YoaK family protein [Microtetraspora sp. NBRC 13810]GLW05692.1 hypothetical protein Misp01_08220 [Microtetraspora sp. NBRC 13810]